MRGSDYDVVYSDFDESYSLRLSETRAHGTSGLPLFDLRAGFAPQTSSHAIAPRADAATLPELSRLNLERLSVVAQQLEAGGLSALSTALNKRIAQAQRGDRALSLRDLESFPVPGPLCVHGGKCAPG